MWKHEIDIAEDLWQFDGSNMGEVGMRVLGKLKRSEKFPNILLTPLTVAMLDGDMEDFDRALEHIYDYADQKRIRLGP